jgi:DNA anti-recombination protein RmuC
MLLGIANLFKDDNTYDNYQISAISSDILELKSKLDEINDTLKEIKKMLEEEIAEKRGY